MRAFEFISEGPNDIVGTQATQQSTSASSSPTQASGNVTAPKTSPTDAANAAKALANLEPNSVIVKSLANNDPKQIQSLNTIVNKYKTNQTLTPQEAQLAAQVAGKVLTTQKTSNIIQSIGS